MQPNETLSTTPRLTGAYAWLLSRDRSPIARTPLTRGGLARQQQEGGGTDALILRTWMLNVSHSLWTERRAASLDRALLLAEVSGRQVVDDCVKWGPTHADGSLPRRRQSKNEGEAQCDNDCETGPNRCWSQTGTDADHADVHDQCQPGNENGDGVE